MSASKGSAFAAVMKQMSASKGAAFITNENSGSRGETGSKINWKKKLRQERKQVKRMHRKHRSK